MILVDSNVLMYAAGADHANKAAALVFLGKAARGEIDAALDAEVLQEILHRYRSLNRWEDGKTVYRLARDLFPDVLPISSAVMDSAKELMDGNDFLSARDAVHAAVLKTYALEAICTFDQDFDRIAGITRVEPSIADTPA